MKHSSEQIVVSHMPELKDVRETGTCYSEIKVKSVNKMRCSSPSLACVNFTLLASCTACDSEHALSFERCITSENISRDSEGMSDFKDQLPAIL